ncbi:leucine-rich repeat-containing G-protein coupled receptor 5-like [Aplysia californica]|uniref:Leucine-rich repeat-containing G-protein coupled receptor 5-like n=1 Tax=Aplysia californica TaxID=6500 RepID=A0ABM1VST1_APLCA|nr:leucine-rich repeat-containing G-protein coupled receptor 5-like [Aplysia californica]
MSSTSRIFSLILVAFTCSQSLAFEHAPRTGESPCDVTDDDVRGGDYVNCTVRGLTSLEPTWFPENATTLSLDHNILHNLASGCFSHLSELQVLTISDSRVTTIHEDALRGLGKLKELNLENNNIYTRRLSRTLFSHVPNLENLYLKGNTWENEGTLESPSSSAVPFSDLSHLTSLAWWLSWSGVWLHTTWVRLDMSGNYSCIDDRGQDRWTVDLVTTKALWRRCVGKTALLVSLSLALSLIVGFLAVYVWRRFRTAVWAFFLNILAPGFR